MKATNKEDFMKQFRWLRGRLEEIGEDNGDKWMKLLSDGKRRINAIRRKLKAKRGKWTRRESRMDATRRLLNAWIWAAIDGNAYSFSVALPSGLWFCGEAIDSDDSKEYCIDNTKISCCVSGKVDMFNSPYGEIFYDFGLAGDNLDCEDIVNSVFRFDKEEGAQLKRQIMAEC